MIENFYFYGIHLTECKNSIQYIRRDEYILIDEQYNSLEDIVNPILNGVYEISSSNNRYIYYNNQWYNFTENNDVVCPVDGIVNYTYELVKGVY